MVATDEELPSPEQLGAVPSGLGSIHIELPGEVRIRLEGSVDPRWMSDAEEDKLRAVLERWIAETPEAYEMTRLELREHPNEITVGSQTGMRKGNQYALTWPGHQLQTSPHHLAGHEDGSAAYRSDDG